MMTRTTTPIFNKVPRRSVLTGLSAFAITSLLPFRANALTDAEANRLIGRLVGDINNVIDAGRPLSWMVTQFERIFNKYGDVGLIARSALGADARRASSAQMSAYTKAFSGYIARRYGKRFEEFIGGKIEVISAAQVPGKSFHEVRTTAILQGEAPFSLNFLVSDRSGKDLFFDMIIEGISVRLSEKNEIGAMLDRRGGNLDLLIQDLKTAG